VKTYQSIGLGMGLLTRIEGSNVTSKLVSQTSGTLDLETKKQTKDQIQTRNDDAEGNILDLALTS
jgi:hypothetical protein